MSNTQRDKLKDPLLMSLILCAKHYSPKLVRINLSNAEIDSARLNIVGDAMVIGQLACQQLDLSENSIKDDGLALLLEFAQRVFNFDLRVLSL